MTIIEKIRDLDLPEDTKVRLSYSEGTDVFVHNETEIETALSQTDVVSTFAELVSTRALQAESAYGTHILNSLREDGHLEDYEKGAHAFAEHITEKLQDNFYDQEFIESSTEKYDHKRGFCTLSTDVQVTVKNLLFASPYLGGWEASVKTDSGTLTLD
tara:strand:- start:16830 stop:17303 length:474 start_codon:yes stop_codon:yes gene_type:complete